MPLLDRVKTQAKQVADQVAHKAQEASQAGQAKIEELQAKRQADAALRRLGLLTYRARQGRAEGDDEAEIQRTCDELATYEREHGTLSA